MATEAAASSGSGGVTSGQWTEDQLLLGQPNLFVGAVRSPIGGVNAANDPSGARTIATIAG